MKKNINIILFIILNCIQLTNSFLRPHDTTIPLILMFAYMVIILTDKRAVKEKNKFVLTIYFAVIFLTAIISLILVNR